MAVRVQESLCCAWDTVCILFHSLLLSCRSLLLHRLEQAEGLLLLELSEENLVLLLQIRLLS